MPKKIPLETRQKILSMHESGMVPVQIALQERVSNSFVYMLIRARARGFDSNSQYETYLAQRRGYPSLSTYRVDLVKKMGFASYTAYQEHLAKKKGFSSLAHYKKELYNRVSQRRENQELSDLIHKRLKELKKSQTWLAEQLHVSRQAVSLYAQGKIIPRNERLERLYTLLTDDRIPKSEAIDSLDILAHED